MNTDENLSQSWVSCQGEEKNLKVLAFIHIPPLSISISIFKTGLFLLYEVTVRKLLIAEILIELNGKCVSILILSRFLCWLFQTFMLSWEPRPFISVAGKKIFWSNSHGPADWTFHSCVTSDRKSHRKEFMKHLFWVITEQNISICHVDIKFKKAKFPGCKLLCLKLYNDCHFI